MSTAEKPGPFDGLERALPDEPVFTLRAHDSLAADLVQLWVDRRRLAILADHDMTDEKRAADLVQAREAEMIAEAMRDWKAGEVAVVTTPHFESKPSYNGNTMDADELAAKARFDTIKGSADRLHNATADIVDAATALETLDAEAYPSERLMMLADELREIATDVQPKRRSYAHRGE